MQRCDPRTRRKAADNEVEVGGTDKKGVELVHVVFPELVPFSFASNDEADQELGREVDEEEKLIRFLHLLQLRSIQ